MAGQRQRLQEEVRFRVLRCLQDNPGISQRDLAAQVGISHGGAHYVLKALLEKGLITLADLASTPDRRRHAYILTPSGLAEKAAVTRRFLARKRAEYVLLKAEIDALQDELGDADATGPAPRGRTAF